MASDKDGSDDPVSPAWSASKAKRPHAILDLEATDVTPPALTDARAEDAGEPAKTEAESGPPPFNEPSADAGDAAPSVESVDAAPPVEPVDAAPSVEPVDAASDEPEPRSSARRGADWTTSLVAGFAGGALAVVLLAALTPWADRLPGASAPSAESLSAVERRIDTLEQAMPLPASPQLGEKLAAQEARAAGLAEAQSRIAAEMKGLAEKAGSYDPAAFEARLAKLESQFATLAASGQENPDAGPIPQLAALSSKLAGIEARADEARKAAAATAADAAALKNDVGRFDQSLGAIKADLAQNGQAARAAQDDAAALRTRVDELAAGIDKQLQTTAKSGDVAAAIAPVAAKIAALEQSVAGVAANEENRRVNAERILLTLELAGLKRAVERGESYARELAVVRAAGAGKWDLSALERSSERGVPALAGLSREFRDVSRAVLDSASEPRDGSIFDRLVAGAKSVVRVRKLDHGAGDASVEAVVSRMGKALEAGRLESVIAEAGRLPPRARAAAGAWLDRVEARHAIDGAIATIENQLRTSLTN